MPIKKTAIRKERGTPEVNDRQAVAMRRLSTQLKRFTATLAKGRSLVEGIDRLGTCLDQMCALQDSLDECLVWITDYLDGQISDRVLTRILHNELAPALLEALDTLIYAKLDHEEQIEALVGPLSLLDDDVESSSCAHDRRDHGVINSILDDEPIFTDETAERFEAESNASYECSRGLLNEIELISSRLVDQIRAEGLLLHSALVAVGS